MTITQLNKKAIAVTGLPEGAYEFRMSVKKTNHLIYRIGEIKADYINLPEGNWTILGFSQDLKEEDWTRVVEKMTWGIENYRNYAIPNDQNQYVGKTPTESGHSLLKSKDLDPLLNHLILIQ